jgi:sulfhydrogenase subunit beta (sulfur reductase)
MKDRILPKENLEDFLQELKKNFQVVVPVDRGQFSLYRPLSGGETICLKNLRPAMSAKEVFFPQNEDLFYFEERSQKSLEAPMPERKTVLFGVRPCDLQGIAAQDRLFETGQFEDLYYERRRQNSILIGLGCSQPEESCFCNSFEIDLHGSPVADLFFNDLGEDYFISVQTEQGDRLVESLKEVSAQERKALADLKSRPVQFSREKIPVEKVRQAVEEHFEDPMWEEIAMQCLSCGACTFVCPTCHCFDITDESRQGLGRRVRTWDTCAFPKFTVHASGHNPRTSTSQRMRQRILHKFSYFRDNQGMISCTGCGRCIEACPVNLDIREAIERLLAQTAEVS